MLNHRTAPVHQRVACPVHEEGTHMDLDFIPGPARNGTLVALRTGVGVEQRAQAGFRGEGVFKLGAATIELVTLLRGQSA